MTTRRHLVAALVTLCGAAITAGSLLPWVRARGSRPASGVTHTSILGLRHFAYAHSAATTSFAVAIALAGILVLIGGLAAWRLLTGPFAAIALATGGAWIVLNAHHYSPTDLRQDDLRTGAWLSLGGSLAALLLTFWMRRRDALADTSPWDSFETLAGHDDGADREPPPTRPAPAMRPAQTMRPAPAWQPGLRGYRPAWRPHPAQTREGFRSIR